MSFEVVSTGRYVPERIVTNEDFVKKIDTTNEWIVSRTGIERRHYVENQTTTDLGVLSAQKAIEKGNIPKERIKAVIVATFTPDYLTPSVACLIQQQLQLPEDILALDINGACSGFIYGMMICDSLLMSFSEEEYILLIGTEVISKVLNFEDRGTCILFGDGAASAILKKREGALGHFSVGSRGTSKELGCIGVDGKGSKSQVYMNGKDVFRFATISIVQCIEDVLKKNKVQKEEIDYVVCHQANKRIIDYAQKKSNIPAEKFYVNIGEYGNTSSASIPIALDEMVEKNLLQRGMKVLLVGFGGGLTWGGTLIEW